MKRTIVALSILGGLSIFVAACGLAAGDTKATVAAEVNATIAAIPPQQVTVPVLVTEQVVVTQEVIVTQQVPVEVPVTVVVEVTVPPVDPNQPTPEPAATNPPTVSTNGQDPLAGANVTPIIDERFDFPNKYYWWTFGSDVTTSGEGKIEDETYILSSFETENYEWTFDGKKLQNFYVTAKTQIPNEQCKATDHWGLVFRYKDNANFYMFGVSCDAKYTLMKRTVDGFEVILPPTDSTAINKFGKTNILGVRAVGDQISLYANDQFLITVTDGSYTEGLIGMYVRTFLTPNMSVVYDDIKAYVINQ
jgi:hypothetical protein